MNFATDSSEGRGGGLGAREVTLSNSINITKTLFQTNTATGMGGGVWGYKASFGILESTFRGNQADMKGGGLYIGTAFELASNGPCVAEVTDSTFEENSALSTKANHGGGGLAVRAGCLVRLKDRTVVVRNKGGGILALQNGLVIAEGGVISMDNVGFEHNTTSNWNGQSSCCAECESMPGFTLRNEFRLVPDLCSCSICPRQELVVKVESALESCSADSSGYERIVSAAECAEAGTALKFPTSSSVLGFSETRPGVRERVDVQPCVVQLVGQHRTVYWLDLFVCLQTVVPSRNIPGPDLAARLQSLSKRFLSKH